MSLALVLAMLAASMQVASAAGPTFELPFECGTTVDSDRFSSGYHGFGDVDFNIGSGDQDRGTPVVSAASGTATFYNPENGSLWDAQNIGAVFVLHSDGYATEYTHLRNIAVSEGQSVPQGRPLGELSDTGAPTYATASHLHFRVTRNGSGVRPTFAVQGGTTAIEHGGRYTSTNCVVGVRAAMRLGDLDGHGGADVLLRRGSRFYLDLGGWGGSDQTWTFGRASDEVFIADFDDDGADDVMLRRGASYFRDLAADGFGGDADHSWTFGRVSDELVTGM